MGAILKQIQLTSRIKRLVAEHGLCAIKTGTEVEDMSFPEIQFLQEMAEELIPVFVKVGGPEARNDIRSLKRIGVKGIIAPMIESPFALRKFIETLQDLYGSDYSQVERGINLETITAYEKLESILESPFASDLHQITAARTDLSASLGLPTDHEHVMEICSDIISRCHRYGLRTSVGGAIHPGVVGRIIETIQPENINTRHMVLHCSTLDENPVAHLQAAMMFEYDLCLGLCSVAPEKRSAYEKRASVIKGRMQSFAMQKR